MTWDFVADVASKTSDRIYTVKRARETGELGCDCPAWRFSRARACKHTREVLALGVAADPSQPLRRPTELVASGAAGIARKALGARRGRIVDHKMAPPASGYTAPAGRRLIELD